MRKWLKCLLSLGPVVVFGLVGLSGCGPNEIKLPFKTISMGTYELGYMREEPKLFIISTPDELNIPGSEISFSHTLTNELRQLDYERFFAILVVQGLKRQGGYSVTVQEITRRGDQVTVRADFVSPAPGTRRTQGFTSPYHLITVSKGASWGQQIQFVLLDNDKSVATITHFVP